MSQVSGPVFVTWWAGRSGGRSAGAQRREPSPLPRKQERGSQDAPLLRRLGGQAQERSGWSGREKRQNQKTPVAVTMITGAERNIQTHKCSIKTASSLFHYLWFFFFLLSHGAFLKCHMFIFFYLGPLSRLSWHSYDFKSLLQFVLGSWEIKWATP